MKKLELKLEDLRVESFDTLPGRRKAGGTVHGNGAMDDDWPALFLPYDEFTQIEVEGGGGGSEFPCNTIDIVKCPPKLPPPAPSFYNTCSPNRTCNAWCCGSGSCP